MHLFSARKPSQNPPSKSLYITTTIGPMLFSKPIIDKGGKFTTVRINRDLLLSHVKKGCRPEQNRRKGAMDDGQDTTMSAPTAELLLPHSGERCV